MLFYYRCKYVLDFFLYCFVSFHALTKQFVFNKIFNLLYKRSSLFILHMKHSLSDHKYKRKTLNSNPPPPHVVTVIWL